MAQPFLAEIRLTSFGFAPKGWALCDGQLMAINQNQALFSLLGTSYGGDGRVTFALPKLQGRFPLAFNNSFSLGQAAGEERHTLVIAEIPNHTHLYSGSSDAPSQASPVNGFWPSGGSLTPYEPTANSNMAPNAIGNTGASQPHENRPPYLVMNYIIALVGIFPSQN
jgi:microcystin-dependent protein